MAGTALIVHGAVEAQIRALSADAFDPSDLAAAALTSKLKTRMAGFLLLAHAEIEHAIELACYGVSGQLATASDPVTAMLAWGFHQQRLEMDGAQTNRKRVPLDTLVSAYNSRVGSNNGIKKANLEALLIPLGVSLIPLNTDVEALEAFGVQRGGLAHLSLSAWTTTDLPSVTVSKAIQAGRSADIVIDAIQAKYAAVVPRVLDRRSRLRRLIAHKLRTMASYVDP